MSVAGEELSVAGEKFSNGIGVQAKSKIKLRLTRKSTRFTCKIGVNDPVQTIVPSDRINIPLTDGTMLFYKTDEQTGNNGVCWWF